MQAMIKLKAIITTFTLHNMPQTSGKINRDWIKSLFAGASARGEPDPLLFVHFLSKNDKNACLR